MEGPVEVGEGFGICVLVGLRVSGVRPGISEYLPWLSRAEAGGPGDCFCMVVPGSDVLGGAGGDRGSVNLSL